MIRCSNCFRHRFAWAECDSCLAPPMPHATVPDALRPAAAPPTTTTTTAPIRGPAAPLRATSTERVVVGDLAVSPKQLPMLRQTIETSSLSPRDAAPSADYVLELELQNATLKNLLLQRINDEERGSDGRRTPRTPRREDATGNRHHLHHGASASGAVVDSVRDLATESAAAALTRAVVALQNTVEALTERVVQSEKRSQEMGSQRPSARTSSLGTKGLRRRSQQLHIMKEATKMSTEQAAERLQALQRQMAAADDVRSRRQRRRGAKQKKIVDPVGVVPASSPPLAPVATVDVAGATEKLQALQRFLAAVEEVNCRREARRRRKKEASLKAAPVDNASREHSDPESRSPSMKVVRAKPLTHDDAVTRLQALQRQLSAVKDVESRRMKKRRQALIKNVSSSSNYPTRAAASSTNPENLPKPHLQSTVRAIGVQVDTFKTAP